MNYIEMIVYETCIIAKVSYVCRDLSVNSCDSSRQAMSLLFHRGVARWSKSPIYQLFIFNFTIISRKNVKLRQLRDVCDNCPQ